MVQDKAEARDKILARLKAVVDAESLVAIYDDSEKQPPNDGTEWIRISVRHAYGDRASFRSREMKARHRRGGVVFVEIYAPINTGSFRCDELAQVFEEAFARPPEDDVWFRNVHSVDVGTDGPWYHVNVLAEFEYDLFQ